MFSQKLNIMWKRSSSPKNSPTWSIGRLASARKIASRARQDMERLFGGKVFLDVWVKVKTGWADDERALKRLGYE